MVASVLAKTPPRADWLRGRLIWEQEPVFRRLDYCGVAVRSPRRVASRNAWRRLLTLSLL